MAQDGLVNNTLVPTLPLSTTTRPNDRSSVSSSGQSVWLPLGLTFAVVLIIIVMVVLAKTKKRAAAMQASQNAEPHITSVSGTMGSNVNVYRNYGIHTSRQTLTSSLSGDQLTCSTATLPPMQFPTQPPTQPPSYDEVMRAEQGGNQQETQQGFADVQQVLARIDSQSSHNSSSPLGSAAVSPAPSYTSYALQS